MSHSLFKSRQVVHPMFIPNWRSMSVYICAQVSYSVTCIPVFICVKTVLCMCMYVCRCALSELILVLQSAVVCCCSSPAAIETLVVAKLLLPLPCYLISCSLFFLSDSKLGSVPPHITPLPPTGCWQFCSSLFKKEINPSRWTFK